MNSLLKLTKSPVINSIIRRGMKLSPCRSSYVQPSNQSGQPDRIAMQNFDPNNYSIPLRTPTMDDLMEPYGSWKDAYAAEKKQANIALVRGIVCLAASIAIFIYSGVADGLLMPNLDNIMEDTEPIEYEQEGRVSVLNKELEKSDE